VRRSPARLVIALSVAAALAVFVIYTAVAGAGTPQIQPSDLARHHGTVLLVGKVVSASGDAHTSAGLRFRLRDVTDGKATRVDVLYHGTVPDLFEVGREVVVTGSLRDGAFVAQDGSLSTKCPSKYAPAKSTKT
jgi:cytochrome c-type biogenesis protein CcmE